MKALCLLTFAAGVLTGSAASYYIVRKKYENIIDKEVTDVKETLKNYYDKKMETKSMKVENKKEDVSETESYKQVIKENYNDEVEEEPYEISSQQFGEFDDYRTETLFYYFGSGIITDEKDNKIDKPEELIGKDYKEILESAEDAYFRNENTKVDYEVIIQLNDEDE